MLKIRDLILGRGRPKICVPISVKNRAELLEISSKINAEKVDLVEFRADYIENNEDIFSILSEARVMISELPLIFTFRTKKEGGNREISVSEYEKICLEACKSGLCDIVDVEFFSGDATVQNVVKTAQKENLLTIISSHDFKKTPAQADIVDRLRLMENQGGDILKIAVMPRDEADVFALMNAVMAAKAELSRPIVAMSMGNLGKLSRVAGEIYGSVITFGSVGKPSAPGQIEVDRLKYMLSELSI